MLQWVLRFAAQKKSRLDKNNNNYIYIRTPAHASLFNRSVRACDFRPPRVPVIGDCAKRIRNTEYIYRGGEGKGGKLKNIYIGEICRT